MRTDNEKIPDPKKIEKEIGDFLHEKYGDAVKLVTPVVAPDKENGEKEGGGQTTKPYLNFDLTPEQMKAYLDQYIIKQESAKRILSTKICTHFNRIKHQALWGHTADMVGGIKNNVLMIGPTGVGKTYLIKLIAHRLGVPFVKGDATKFSETGYVGGDVEDLVRDLVREAGDDIELAQHGIVYIDEIDKIASAQNMMGADVSRSGVQRALLTLMEETEVEMKVPHDPVSIMQEVERYRKTGTKEKRVVNTKNILFIMSGSFDGLQEIINKRLSKQAIGFSATIASPDEDPYAAMKNLKSEDLSVYGFEAEFVGRLPVRAVFESLTEADLFEILKNPSNPVVLGKKMDFAAYGIDIRFADEAFQKLAHNAYQERTGARGLVNAVERALIQFESNLPSTAVERFPVTGETVDNPDKAIADLLSEENNSVFLAAYNSIRQKEKQSVRDYIEKKCYALAKQHDFSLTPEKIDLLTEFIINRIATIESAIASIKSYYEETKNIATYFRRQHDLKVELSEDAVIYLVRQYINNEFSDFEKKCQELTRHFVDGFKLLSEKTGRREFEITQQALMFPESWLDRMIKNEFGVKTPKEQFRSPTHETDK